MLSTSNWHLLELAYQPGSHLDLSIEGMRSQRFSVGVFLFLLVCVFVFCGIIYAVIKSDHSPGRMRTGERILFGAIIAGVIVAVIFGATQMLSGVLF